ncbi:MAG: FKBP-type peptidyl-prolyl cis-trans isomerase [Pseudomonadota bacterium]
MTEITRVPIQPVAKGSLTKLWLGVIIAALIGAGLAWAAIPKGLSVDTLAAGEGENPGIGDMVFVKYTGKLADTGEVFDQHQEMELPVADLFPDGTPFPVEEGATIPGFFQALQQVKKGGEYEIYIPSDQAYGEEGSVNPQTGEAVIPPNADLIFDLEVVDFMTRDEFDRRLGILQQAIGMGPGGPGGPQGGPDGAPQEQPAAPQQ